MTLEKVLKYLVIGGIFLVPFIPLVVANQFFFPFITGKNFAFRIIVEVVFGAWALLALLDAQYRPKRSWLLYAVSAFVGIVLLADALGANAFKSFWSNFERMEGGIALLHLWALFVVLISTLKTEKMWGRLAATSLGVSVILGIYGILQLSGALEIHQGGVRLDATLGNATYFAAYMLFHAFIALIMLAQVWVKGGWTKWLLIAVAALDILILFFTQTRGTILGLVGGFLLAGILVVFLDKRKGTPLKRIAIGGSIVLVLCAGAIFALKDQPFVKESPLVGRLASISLSEGQTRFTIWGMAWQGFLERPVLGWGQENFNFVFNEYYQPSLATQEPWFDRAHNVFLDWLIAGGILGLLGYLSLFGIAAWWLLLRKDNPLSLAERSLFVGLLAGYFVHNLFVFDNLTSSILFIGVLAYLAHRYEAQKPVLSSRTLSSGSVAVYAMPVVTLLVLTTIYFANVPGMNTAHALLQVIAAQEGGIPENKEWAERALSYDALGRQEVRERLLDVAFRVNREQLADQQTAQEFLALARRGMEQEVARNGEDARLRVFFGSFLRQVGDITAAEVELTKAHELSPGKQYIRFELGFLAFQRNDLAKAIQIFKEAYELDENYDGARVYYAVLLMYAGDQAHADQLLAEKFGSPIVDNDYILQAYIDTKQFDRAVAIAEMRVAQTPDVNKISQLANAYRQAGRNAEAIATARKAAELDPSVKGAVDEFITLLGGTP